jgi:hypothetical protein
MATEFHKTHDVITLVAIGVAAYILADVTHEVVGHSGICLLTGGRITLLTSVFFRNQPDSRIVAAAGPLANLVMGMLLWLLSRSKQNWRPASRLFLVFAGAFNLFWAAGYFIYSGVGDTGDWAIALGGPPLELVSRASLITLGVVSYFVFTRSTARAFAQVSKIDMRKLVFVPYFAAGTAACIAAVFYAADPIGALAGAARESFLANIVLLAVPWRSMPKQSSADAAVARDNRWLTATVISFVVFVLILGRGAMPH